MILHLRHWLLSLFDALVIIPFQCCLLLLLFNMHVATHYHQFWFLFCAYSNSIVGTFGLVPTPYYWFLLFDTCNYSSPHTSPYVFALNKSWEQLTFRLKFKITSHNYKASTQRWLFFPFLPFPSFYVIIMCLCFFDLFFQK